MTEGRIDRVRSWLDRFLPAGSTRRRFAKGVAWASIGAGLAQIIGMVVSILVARHLGRSVLGELGVIGSTLGIVGVVAGLGLGSTTARYVAANRGRDPARSGRIAGMTWFVAVISGLLMAGLLVLLAPQIATYVINAPDLVPELRIAAIILLASTISSTQSAGLTGFEAFSTIAGLATMQAVVNGACLLTGVYLGDLRGAVIGQAVAAVFGLIVNHVAFHFVARSHGVRVDWTGWRSELPILWSFSFPAMLAGRGGGLFGQIEGLVIGGDAGVVFDSAFLAGGPILKCLECCLRRPAELWIERDIPVPAQGGNRRRPREIHALGLWRDIGTLIAGEYHKETLMGF